MIVSINLLLLVRRHTYSPMSCDDVGFICSSHFSARLGGESLPRTTSKLRAMNHVRSSRSGGSQMSKATHPFQGSGTRPMSMPIHARVERTQII